MTQSKVLFCPNRKFRRRGQSSKEADRRRRTVMLSRIQYLVEGIFQSSSRFFHRVGLSPNSLTVLGFLLWIAASLLYWGGLSGWEWGASILVLVVAGYFDAVDGAMARNMRRCRSLEESSTVCLTGLEKSQSMQGSRPGL